MMNEDLLKDIKNLDDNAKLIVKHGLFGTLAMIKNAENNILEIIRELEK